MQREHFLEKLLHMTISISNLPLKMKKEMKLFQLGSVKILLATISFLCNKSVNRQGTKVHSCILKTTDKCWILQRN